MPSLGGNPRSRGWPTHMYILVVESRHNVSKNRAYDVGRSAGIGEELEGREWEIYLI